MGDNVIHYSGHVKMMRGTAVYFWRDFEDGQHA